MHKLTMPVSASAAHSLANVRKTREEMVEEVRAIVALRRDIAPQVELEAGISTAFGCTLQGEVPEDEVIRLAAQCVGGRRRRGRPVRHRRLRQSGAGAAPVPPPARRDRRQGRRRALAQHARPGPGQLPGGLEEGVRTFDASLGGLGGCPYAPGASGNVVTEDLVFMFEAMGVRTGIDLDQLIAARAAADGRPAGRAGLRHDARGRPAEGLRPRRPPMAEPSTATLPSPASASSSSPTW